MISFPIELTGIGGRSSFVYMTFFSLSDIGKAASCDPV